MSRHERDTNPPWVEYRLTDEGRSLAPVLQAMYDWGQARANRTGATIVEPAGHAEFSAAVGFPTTCPPAE